LKLEYLGKMEEGHQTEDFLRELKEVWELKRYKDKKRCKLFQALIRTSFCKILIVILTSFITMGLDVLQVYLFREYIRIYEVIPEHQFSKVQLGIAFLSSKLLSSLISKQNSVANVRQFNNN
jgi:hypothetical protein